MILYLDGRVLRECSTCWPTAAADWKLTSCGRHSSRNWCTATCDSPYCRWPVFHHRKRRHQSYRSVVSRLLPFRPVIFDVCKERQHVKDDDEDRKTSRQNTGINTTTMTTTTTTQREEKEEQQVKETRMHKGENKKKSWPKRECYFCWKQLYSMQVYGAERLWWIRTRASVTLVEFLAQMAAAVEYKHRPSSLVVI